MAQHALHAPGYQVCPADPAAGNQRRAQCYQHKPVPAAAPPPPPPPSAAPEAREPSPSCISMASRLPLCGPRSAVAGGGWPGKQGPAANGQVGQLLGDWGSQSRQNSRMHELLPQPHAMQDTTTQHSPPSRTWRVVVRQAVLRCLLIHRLPCQPAGPPALVRAEQRAGLVHLAQQAVSPDAASHPQQSSTTSACSA